LERHHLGGIGKKRKIMIDFKKYVSGLRKRIKKEVVHIPMGKGGMSTTESAYRNRHTAWNVLALGLIITAIATLHMKYNVEEIAKKEFAFNCDEIQYVISNRMEDHARVLLSGAALFEASEVVTRKEWRIFTHHQRIEKQLPGIQGIGFSVLIPRTGLNQHIQEIRSEGFPEYTVKPEGDREVYSSIIYLEPFTARNLRAFGYDMLSEPVRRTAMEKARDMNSAALSGKVVLVQETGRKIQPGTLMYVPVYRRGMPIDSVEQRRAAIYGWVYSPYRMNDLMEGILGRLAMYEKHQFQLMIFDGEQPSRKNLLYKDSSARNYQASSEVRFTRQIPVYFNGHRWTLNFSQTGSNSFFTAEYAKAWIVLLGGTLITLLLFAFIRVFLNTRTMAQKMAEELTVNLRKNEEKFYAIANYTVDWEIWFGTDGKILWMNPAVENTTGYSAAEVMAMPDFISTLVAAEDRDLFTATFREALRGGKGKDFEFRHVHKNGRKFWLGWSWQPIFDTKGDSLGVRASGRDITEHKKEQEELRNKTAFLSGLLASIPDIVFFKNLEGVYLGCNPEFARLVNRSVANVVGATDYDLFGKEIADFFRTQDNIMIDQGNPRHNEEWIQYPDGVRVLIDTCKAPLKDINGRIIGVLGISRDITYRRQAENTLQKISERLELATRAGGVGIWDWDVVNNRLSWDDQMYRLYGITSNKFSGAYEAWGKGLHPDDALRGDSEIQTALRGGKEFNTEFRVLWPDGTVHNIRALALVQRDADGKPLRMIGTNWDVTAQKQLEEKLKSGEENFRTFFQTVDDIIVVGTPDGRILFANDAFTNKLGYGGEDLKNIRILDMHPEECRKEAETIFGAMLCGERDFCPLPLQTKDGIRLPVETRIWFGKWNGAECIFGISKDLSIQQAALEKFEKMFRSNPALMAVSSLSDRKFIDVNDSFLKRLGFTRNEVVGRTVSELNLFTNPELQEKIVSELGSRGRISGAELKIREKNGELADGLFFAEIIDNQGQKVILSVMADLTPLKQTEAALIYAANMTNLLMELSSHYINIPLNEVDTSIQSSLRKMAEFVLADRAYVFSYNFKKGITSNDYEWCNTNIEPQIDQLKEVPLDMIQEWVNTHRKGRYMYVEDVSALPHGGLRKVLEPQGIKSLIAVPMMSDNECIGFVGFDSVRKHHSYSGKEITFLTLFSQMLVNVTNRAKAERDLIVLNEQLGVSKIQADELATQATLANTAKSRFLSHMSHEIRTPLNAILGFSQLLQHDLELTASQKQRVQTINRSGEHLLALLNDILELSKIEAGVLILNPTSFDFRELLQDLILMFRTRAQAKNLTLSTHGLELVSHYLIADEQKLRQILINLLSNAVKYTVAGGISLQATIEGAANSRLVILVEDSGLGIATEEINHLFTPFEQTSTGRNTGTGTGLGLVISRQFARLMGGDVTVTSEVGKGSVFRLEIPVKEGTESVKNDIRQIQRLEPDQPSYRILVAEDDYDSRLLLVQMLEDAGFEVFEALNGQEAVEVFSKKQPQLILMDNWMPIMRGDEAIRRIRKSVGGTAVKIITLTANASEETRQLSLESGSDDFMGKPFRHSELFEKIRHISGVRYIYAESPVNKDVPPPEQSALLTREMIDSLPTELRREMRIASISCRHDQLLKLIQQATVVSPEIGENLRSIAIKFDYNTLTQLLS
jgi:PAS domain S-box-containing protein